MRSRALKSEKHSTKNAFTQNLLFFEVRQLAGTKINHKQNKKYMFWKTGQLVER